MKKLKYFDKILWLLFIVSVGYFAVVQFNKKPIINLSKLSKTDIKWLNDTTINLGLVPQNNTVNFSTTIYNTGNNKLFIQGINPSCGCTKVDFSNSEVLPNDSATITGTIKTSVKAKDLIIISFKANTAKVNHNLYVMYKTTEN